MILKLIVGFAIAAFTLRFAYWMRQGWIMQRNPGYLPPPPSKFANFVYKFFASTIGLLYLGRTRFYGVENCAFDGRLVITPNHQHGLDPFAITPALPYSYRAIGSGNVLKGPLAGMAAWVGTVTVPTTGGKAERGGGAVVEACANIIASGPLSRFLIFLQGHLVYLNILRPDDFRTGAIRASRQAQEKITDGSPIGYLPTGIAYITDPSKACWLRRIITFCLKCIFFRFTSTPKYGAVVVFGKTILLSELPEDRHAATQILGEQIKIVSDQANEIAAGLKRV